jgi:hypothetical protein
MIQFSDQQLTHAVQGIGLVGVQQLQQELVEGLRDGNPRGFPALRKLMVQLDKQAAASADQDQSGMGTRSA